MSSAKKWAIAALMVTVAVVSVCTLNGWHAKVAPDKKMKTVAIVTLVAHPALDSLQNSLVKELAAQGFRDGEQISLTIRNANGQMQLLPTIASDIAAMRPDVTVSITTPVSQAIVNSVQGRVVFSAVSDPVGAGIIPSLNTTSERITGATDAWPYDEQIRLIKRITPAVRRLGVIYNPAEAASQYGMRQIRTFALKYDLEIVEGAVSSSSEVLPVAEILARKSDALMLSSDSTAIGGVAGALRVAIRQRIPLYVGDSGTVSKGGLAAVSIGYERLGTQTGLLVARMLRGETLIPIVSPDGSDVYVNTRAAELMKVTIPPAVLEKAHVIESISQ